MTPHRGFNATFRAGNELRESFESLPAASATTCVAAKRTVSHTCRQCILATIAHICGSRCAQERLHVILDGPLPPALRCLPSLADQLTLDQVGKLEHAISLEMPFGLSSAPSLLGSGPSLTDLCMPRIGVGQPTRPVAYVGVDSGNRIVRCDPAAFPGLMVVTHSTEPGASTDRRGSVWLDLRTGQTRLQLHPPSSIEFAPFLVHHIPSECSPSHRPAGRWKCAGVY